MQTSNGGVMAQIRTHFISDLHLYHENIIEWARPQFKSLDEMHDCIADNWQKAVNPWDNVFILGDVSLNDREAGYLLLSGLNGNKRLIMGNHDNKILSGSDSWLADAGIEWAKGVHEYKRCVLTHIPVHPCQKDRFKLNIHGHLHTDNVMKNVFYNVQMGNIPEKDTFYFNVSAEQINLTPITWTAIKEQVGWT